MKIGFIGLGLMGQGFVRRLIERGHVVTGYDIVAEKLAAATAHGVRPAQSPAQVANECQLVMLSVISTDAVGQVVFGPGGVAETATPGKILIDFSTTEAPVTRQLADRLRRETGMGWIDAPVSGGPEAALSGTLAVMAGGDEVDFAVVSEVLGDVASVLTHMGPVGAGQVTKMVNQILVLNTYAVLAEALSLAEAGGVDAAKIPAALASGHAGSNLLRAVFPRLIERDFAPRGYARQVLKDLDMVKDLARGLKVPTPMSSQAAELYRILVAKGHGEIDGTAILKLYDPKDQV